MSRRPPAALLGLTLGLLGLLVGLGDFAQLMRFPVDRLAEFRRFPPIPRSIFWIEGLQGAAAVASGAERLLIGLSVIFLIGVLLLLGATLSPRFRLLKPAGQNPGEGLGSHVDLRQMGAIALAVLVTLLLLGALRPLGLLASQGADSVWSRALGGLPGWVGSNGPGSLLIISLLLLPALWWLWGPRGPLFPDEGAELRGVLFSGFLAAGAALPSLVILFAARQWLTPASIAFSLADRGGWLVLILMALLLPVVACLLLGVIGRMYAPRPAAPPRLTRLALGALLGVGIGIGIHALGLGALRGLDVGTTSVAARLGLPPSELQRFAYILTPSARVAKGATLDGVTTNGEDQINSHAPARVAVREFLRRKRYRTTLAFGAFSYLDACYALDWNPREALKLELEMLERAPSPVVAELLVRKLTDCSTGPENRAVLDRIADPKAFYWPEPEGSRRLGAAYARFGDLERAREYLLRAGLDPREQRELLGGISPLADGVVRGRLSLLGKSEAAIRVGLVDARNWRGMTGLRRPYAWRAVVEHTHTDAQGRFEFQHIPQGSYVLVVTGGGIGRYDGVPSAQVHPAVVELNRFRPIADLKPIDIRLNRPTGIPPDMDPGMTV